MPTRKVMVAAKPKYGRHFDPWYSAVSGHQRLESRLPIAAGWRESRSTKVSSQLKSIGTGGIRDFDNMGQGFEIWEETKTLGPGDNKLKYQCTVVDMMGEEEPVPLDQKEKPTSDGKIEELALVKEIQNPLRRKRGIFDGLVIYINGSTYPLISDHKLKQVLVENGAKLSFHLGRRQVTHVILGKPAGTRGAGAGGGLAGSKLDKEIKKVGGCGVKYVGVEWALESLKAGKRQAEAPFVNLKIAAKGQQSVYNMFKKPAQSNPIVTESI